MNPPKKPARRYVVIWHRTATAMPDEVWGRGLPPDRSPYDSIQAMTIGEASVYAFPFNCGRAGTIYELVPVRRRRRK